MERDSDNELAVGSNNTGPAPQIQPPAVGDFGEKKKLGVMSPRPDSFSASTGKSAWSTSGMRVRVIRFQSSFSENGITGWMTSLLTAAPSLVPPHSS